jgi:hypothetical protein
MPVPNICKATSLTLSMLLSMGSIASAQENSGSINSFTTDTGVCAQSDLDFLKGNKQGFSYTVRAVDIRAEAGGNPPKTGNIIPAMVGVSCHASDGDLVLVSHPDDPAYCGWVPADSLLRTKSKRSGGIFADSENVCGDIAPLTVAEYCTRMGDLGASVEGCDDAKISASSINAKFLVWNAFLSKEQRTANAEKVNKFRTLEAAKTHRSENPDTWGSLDLFTILRIYDVDSVDDEVFYLVGRTVRDMYGWVHQESGALWYSGLATFFTRGSTGEIFDSIPWLTITQKIAEAPGNLAGMLSGQKEFSQYPVLFERRIRGAADR